MSAFSEGRYSRMWSSCCRSFSKKWTLSSKEHYPHLTKKPFISQCVYLFIPLYLWCFIQTWPFLLRPPWSPLFLCCWFLFMLFLIIIGNRGCALLLWVIRSWLKGDQLQKPINQILFDYHPHLLPLLLMPGIPLLWLNEKIFPSLFFLRYSWIWLSPREIGKE